MHNISSIVAFGITGRLRLSRKPERCRWETRAAALREAGRLRIAAETYRWLAATK